MRARTLLWAVLVFGGIGCAHARPSTHGQFLYQLSCDAKLDRFDSVAQKKTGTYDLTKVPGAAALIPAVTGALEVCLTRPPLFDARASVFHTVVPAQAQPPGDGPTSYRVLGFSIPAVALVAPDRTVPFDAPPRLISNPATGARMAEPSDAMPPSARIWRRLPWPVRRHRTASSRPHTTTRC